MCEPVAEMAGHFRRAPAAATSTRTLLGRVGLILTLKGDDLRTRRLALAYMDSRRARAGTSMSELGPRTDTRAAKR